MRLKKLQGICLLVLLVCGACAQVQTKPAASPSSERSLWERANAYWQAKIKGDLEKTYLLETPDFRKRIRLLDYVKAYSGGFLFREARLESVTIDGSSARVDLVIRTHLLGIRTPKKGITRHLADYWKLVDGHWYHTTSPRTKKRSQTR
jgi:hypothetical protein